MQRSQPGGKANPEKIFPLHRCCCDETIAIQLTCSEKTFLDIAEYKKCPLQLEPLIAAGAFNEAGGLQFSRVIERSLVDVFVPFLPLERTHVKTCVRNEFQRRGIVTGPEVGYF